MTDGGGAKGPGDPASAVEDLLATVSHELKTPLTVLRASLEFLERYLPDEPPSVRKAHELTMKALDRMNDLIAEVMDAGRLRHGLDIVPAEVGSEVLATDAVEAVEPIAERAGVPLEISAAPVVLSADRARIVRVLTNLLTNAVKYSPPGLAVRLEVEASDAEVTFHVQDQGRGIPQHLLDSIFEPFEQAHPDSVALGGSGLGLTICRRIVEGHGGRIWATSEEGAGSRFSFALPRSGPRST